MNVELIFMNIIAALLNTGIMLSISYYFLPRNKKLQEFFKTYWLIFHPNIISMWRGIVGPIFGYWIYKNFHLMSNVELTILMQTIVFLANSDALDGQVARHCNMTTQIGKSLDAFCDKLFDLPILLALSYHIHEYLFFIVCVILCVDLIGQLLRSTITNKAAEIIGKTKTCVKFTSMFFLFIYLLSLDVQVWTYSLAILFFVILVSLLFTGWSMGIKLKNSSIFA
jgi:phosphatidylglycerophosphate synthase